VLFSSTITTYKLPSQSQCGTELRYSIEENSNVITPLFYSFTLICVFRAQNNKSNYLYLQMMAQCNRRTRNWTTQTLGTWPQCAVCLEQENTEIYKRPSMRKTFMDKYLDKFKDTTSLQEMRSTFYKSFWWCYVISNVGNLRLPEEISAHGSENCGVKIQHFAKFETHQRFYYIAKCVCAYWVGVTMGCDLTISNVVVLLGTEQLHLISY